MEQVQEIFQTIWSYFQFGFYQVNTVKGLLIAAIVAYMMGNWRQLVPSTLLAVLVHVILSVMIPVLASGSAFKLPPLVELSYWNGMLSLFAGYLIVVSVFFIVKTVVLRRSGGH
jgi:hypothetical protein